MPPQHRGLSPTAPGNVPAGLKAIPSPPAQIPVSLPRSQYPHLALSPGVWSGATEGADGAVPQFPSSELGVRRGDISNRVGVWQKAGYGNVLWEYPDSWCFNRTIPELFRLEMEALGSAVPMFSAGASSFSRQETETCAECSISQTNSRWFLVLLWD